MPDDLRPARHNREVRRLYREGWRPSDAEAFDGQDLLERAVEGGWRFDGMPIEDDAPVACLDDLAAEYLQAQVADRKCCYVRHWASSSPENPRLMPRRHRIRNVRAKQPYLRARWWMSLVAQVREVIQR